MYDFHWSNIQYMNPSRATIPLIRPHQCDSDGGRIRGVLLHNQEKYHVYLNVFCYKIVDHT